MVQKKNPNRVPHHFSSPYYAFPILLWLPKVDWKNDFLWDFVAAVGVSCMLIPQALSYALLAGVPPAMGLYTAWVRLNQSTNEPD